MIVPQGRVLMGGRRQRLAGVVQSVFWVDVPIEWTG